MKEKNGTLTPFNVSTNHTPYRPVKQRPASNDNLRVTTLKVSPKSMSLQASFTVYGQ